MRPGAPPGLPCFTDAVAAFASELRVLIRDLARRGDARYRLRCGTAIPQDFLRKCLARQPSKRLSLDGVRRHPWFLTDLADYLTRARSPRHTLRPCAAPPAPRGHTTSLVRLCEKLRLVPEPPPTASAVSAQGHNEESLPEPPGLQTALDLEASTPSLPSPLSPKNAPKKFLVCRRVIVFPLTRRRHPLARLVASPRSPLVSENRAGCSAGASASLLAPHLPPAPQNPFPRPFPIR